MSAVGVPWVVERYQRYEDNPLRGGKWVRAGLVLRNERTARALGERGGYRVAFGMDKLTEAERAAFLDGWHAASGVVGASRQALKMARTPDEDAAHEAGVAAYKAHSARRAS